jgi:hypothetical protein
MLVSESMEINEQPLDWDDIDIGMLLDVLVVETTTNSDGESGGNRTVQPSVCGNLVGKYRPHLVTAKQDKTCTLVPIGGRGGKCFKDMPSDEYANYCGILNPGQGYNFNFNHSHYHDLRLARLYDHGEVKKPLTHVSLVQLTSLKTHIDSTALKSQGMLDQLSIQRLSLMMRFHYRFGRPLSRMSANYTLIYRNVFAAANHAPQPLALTKQDIPPRWYNVPKSLDPGDNSMSQHHDFSDSEDEDYEFSYIHSGKPTSLASSKDLRKLFDVPEVPPSASGYVQQPDPVPHEHPISIQSPPIGPADFHNIRKKSLSQAGYATVRQEHFG